MDAFALFDESPRPWLDPEGLKQKFLALSADIHPDKFQDPGMKLDAERRFSALNEAYNLLRQTRARLLHFLEQQGVPNGPHVQNVPAAALDFFNLIAEQTRKADHLLKQKTAASSPMLKVQFFEQALAATTEIQDLQTRLADRIRMVEAEIRMLDDRWSASQDRSLFPALQSAASALGFLDRWNSQLQQLLAALAF